MRHSNITATRSIDNRLLLDKDIYLLNMEKSISKKISFKALAAKPFGKPPLGDKTCGHDTAIHFYDIEEGDKIEEGEKHKYLSFITQA